MKVKNRISKIWGLVLLLSLVLLFSPSLSPGFTNVVGGETITWNFEGIPDSSFSGPNPAVPCGFTTVGYDHYECIYYIIDPPYGQEITFALSMVPSHGTNPEMALTWYEMGDLNDFFPHLIREKIVFDLNPIDFTATFFIPQLTSKFTFSYNSGQGSTAYTNIHYTFYIYNWDRTRTNLLAGDDNNPDTEFCDERAQPGKPQIRKNRYREGAGPGT